MNREDIANILYLAKQFDKENYGARISGHFDSPYEYEQMLIEYIYKNLKYYE